MTQQAIDAAVREIVEHVKTLLAEEIAALRDEMRAHRGIASGAYDGRSKTWGCTIVFRRRNTLDDDWQVAGLTEGAVLDDAGELSAYACERVKSLAGIADTIAEYAAALDAPDDFRAQNMLAPVANLRPTLTRRNGVAAMRRSSADGLWHLSCYVFREDRIPA